MKEKGGGLTARLAFSVTSAVIGSAFQHGYQTGVLNAPQKHIEQFINNTQFDRTGSYLTKEELTPLFSSVVSIFCLGGLIGGISTGLVADRFGRKGGLLLNNIFVLVAGILMFLCKSAKMYELLIVARFLVGINCGLNAGLTPMYLSEISPGSIRGSVGSTYQLTVTIAILISQVLGLPSILGDEESWHILLGLMLVPGIIQVLTLPLCPESPKYLLINKGLDVRSQSALKTLRGHNADIHDEMEEMKAEAEQASTTQKASVKDMFKNPLKQPMIIAIMVMLAQQLSGINAVFFFSTKIFKDAGLDDDKSTQATILIGVINVIMTIVSLVLVEKAGRKQLLLTGFGGMCITTVLLTLTMVFQSKAPWISYMTIVFVILFVVMFAVGPGSIPWFLVAELFGQNARSTATSIAVGINWGANFIVGFGFLPLAEALEAKTFLVFTVILALFWVYIWKKVPETKGKTIDDINALFRQKTYQ